MRFKSNFSNPLLLCKGRRLLLAICWCAGLITGAIYSTTADELSILMMRTAPLCCVSIPGLLAVGILPFLISVFTVYIHKSWLLLPISFGKAFTFSLSACLISMAFGAASWLVRALLMFTDSLMCPALCLFWLRYIPGVQQPSIKELISFLFYAAIVILLDHIMITPFLTEIAQI